MTTSRVVRFGVCLLIAMGGVAAVTPAAAEETLYIPLNRDLELIDGTVYGTRLRISNLDPDTIRRLSYYVVPQGQSGLDEAGELTHHWTLAQATRGVDVPHGPGLLVVSGAPDLMISARWSRQPALGADLNDGTALPVLTCKDAAPAEGEQMLHGLERRDSGTTSVSSFSVINFGEEPSTCAVTVTMNDGTSAIADATLAVAPKSSMHFRDVLGALGLDDVSNNRIAVTCDQAFYSYGTVVYGATGSASTLRPTHSLSADEVEGDGCSETTDGGGGDGGGGDGGGNNGNNDPTGNFVYLSDLSWAGVSSIQAGPYRDRAGFDGHVSPPIGGYKPIDLAGTRYQKGISWFGAWSRNSAVTWNLNGNYRLLTTKVGFDDYVDIFYEWGIVNTQTHQFVTLQRPPDGWGGRERPNQFRIAASGTLRFYADGTLIHETPEMHRYSPAFDVTLDLRGVTQLRVEMNINAHEELNAPYRNGLTRREFVIGNSWFDHPVLAEPRLYGVN